MQKRYVILAFVLFFGASAAFAQKTRNAAPQTAEKTKPIFDPTIFNPPIDNVPPTITCLNGLNGNLFSDGLIKFWAAALLESVHDNVTPDNQIQLGVRKAGTGLGFPVDTLGSPLPNVLFDCDEIGAQTIEIWAKDLAGNVSHCETTINILDPGGFCTTTPGLVEACSKIGVDCYVDNIQFTVLGTDSQGATFQMSQVDGCAKFYLPVGSSGAITPTKDDDPKSGVTPYDWVLIRKHLNGSQPFISPYQYIAADVNRDGVLDIQDSIDMYQVILGIAKEFPNNIPLRFVPQDYVFQFPDNPLSEVFPEGYTFSNIQDELALNFIPIKTGDVSFSFACNNLTDPTTAEKTALSFDPTVVSPPSDVVPPTITCLNGLSVNLMPTGLTSLWASDFLLYAEDDVTPTNQIRIGIRKAGMGVGFPIDATGALQNNILYDCDEQGAQTIELWAMDLAGNVSHCETGLIIQDNYLNCGGGGGNGKICVESICDQHFLEEVALQITGNVNFMPPFSYFILSSNQGCWNVPPSVPLASTFHITPSQDDHPLDGVSQYDLQLLSKHIHGIQPFTEPWQWVAADVNHDNVVDIQDSIELSNLMLGIYQELPNNSSWRFVRSDYVFPSPNPLSQPFPESVTVGEWMLAGDIKFLGIKIGDLSCLEPMPLPERNDATKVIERNEAESRIVPNPTPAGSTLILRLRQAETIHLQVHDISGKLMFDKELWLPAGEQSIEIPSAALPFSGLYFWNVQVAGKLESGKLLRI